MNKDTKIKIAVYGVLLLLVIGLIIGVSSDFSDSETQTQTTEEIDFSMPKKEHETFESKLSAYKKDNEKEHKRDMNISFESLVVDTTPSEIITEVNQVEKKVASEYKPVKKVVSTKKKTLYQDLKKSEPVVRYEQRNQNESGSYFHGSTSFKEQQTNNKNTATVNKTNEVDAVIENDLLVSDGSKITFRVTESATIGGVSIPRNTIVNGIAKITTTRIFVTIYSLSINREIIPINLSVYETDGLQGIELTHSQKQKIAKETVNDGMDNGVNINTPLGGISTGALKKSFNNPEIPLSKNHHVILKIVQ